MDLDQLKQTWNSQQFKTPDLPKATGHRIDSADAARRRLSNRFRMATIMATLMAINIWPLADVIGTPLWLDTCMCVYFVIMAILSGLSWRQTQRIDFGALTLTDAIRKVVRLRRTMTLRLVAGIAMAAPLLSVLLLHFLHDSYSLVCGVAGGIVGGIAGFIICQRNFTHIKEMQRIASDVL